MSLKMVNYILSKNIHLWLGSYLKSLLTPRAKHAYLVKDIIFAVVDHFEPFKEGNYEIIDLWQNGYPKLASNYRDSDGFPPQHTWFFPIEMYDPVVLEKLANLCKGGYGEIEIHLHHRNDTEETFRDLIRKGIKDLITHGALKPHGKQYKPRFGFVHGDWALNNSRKDGELCGVNNELKILREEGCYADFTLPSAPSETQTKKINSIYYARSYSEIPKGHNSGMDVRVGGDEWGDLMIIQGPLGFNWKEMKGMLPRIENGQVSCANPGTKERIKLWEKTNIHVKGRPEWVFIKLHSHGGFRNHIDALLGEKAKLMHKCIKSMYRDNPSYRVHYVTARQYYNIIKAAEAGETGNPNNFRDYIIPPPENRRKLVAPPLGTVGCSKH